MTHYVNLYNDYLITILENEKGIQFNAFDFSTLEDYSAIIDINAKVTSKEGLMTFFTKCLEKTDINYKSSITIDKDDLLFDIDVMFDNYIHIKQLFTIKKRIHSTSELLNIVKLNYLIKQETSFLAKTQNKNQTLVNDVCNIDMKNIENPIIDNEDRIINMISCVKMESNLPNIVPDEEIEKTIVPDEKKDMNLQKMNDVVDVILQKMMDEFKSKCQKKNTHNDEVIIPKNANLSHRCIYPSIDNVNVNNVRLPRLCNTSVFTLDNERYVIDKRFMEQFDKLA